MAVAQYENRLKGILDGNFSGTEGGRFLADQGVKAAQRQFSASGMGASGNALVELLKLGTGYAAQDRGAEIDRLTKLIGGEQQFALGSGANANTAEANRLTGVRDANSFTIGQGANANNAFRNIFDYDLGIRGTDNARRTGDQNFGLGMYRAGNDFRLGGMQDATNRQRNAWDYGVGMTNAGTNRFNAYSMDWNNRQRNARDWWSTLA